MTGAQKPGGLLYSRTVQTGGRRRTEWQFRRPADAQAFAATVPGATVDAKRAGRTVTLSQAMR